MDPQLTISLEFLYQLLETSAVKVELPLSQKQQLVDSITAGLLSSGAIRTADIALVLDRINGIQCTLCKNDKVREAMAKCASCQRIVHIQCLNETGTCSRRCRDSLKAAK